MNARLDGQRRSDAKDDGEKLCAHCGESFTRKRFANNRLEDFTGFQRRSFCSRACAEAGKQRPKTGIAHQAFFDRLDKSSPNGCWTYTMSRNAKGYGLVYVDSRGIRAHVFAYNKAFGPIPKGMMVCHKCDEPSCCNPEHLFLGTASDNSLDMVTKGRAHKKLSAHEVREIRRLWHSGGVTQQDLADTFGVYHTTVHKIVNRLTWRWLS